MACSPRFHNSDSPLVKHPLNPHLSLLPRSVVLGSLCPAPGSLSSHYQGTYLHSPPCHFFVTGTLVGPPRTRLLFFCRNRGRGVRTLSLNLPSFPIAISCLTTAIHRIGGFARFCQRFGRETTLCLLKHRRLAFLGPAEVPHACTIGDARSADDALLMRICISTFQKNILS